MLKDLKAFLLRGNIVDLAVAVIIGAAFGAIVTSFVNDIITPLILNPALKAAGVEKIAELTWNGVAYGSFLSAVINFIVKSCLLKSATCLQTNNQIKRSDLLVRRSVFLSLMDEKKQKTDRSLFLYSIRIFYVYELLLIYVYVLQKVFHRIHVCVFLEEYQL